MINWDDIKHLMAKAHCGKDYGMCYKDDLERTMVIAFMRDYVGDYSTILITLDGSPPKAYTIIMAITFFNPCKDDKIYFQTIKIFGAGLHHYRTIDVLDFKVQPTLSFRELFAREDVRIMNCEIKDLLRRRKG